MIFFMLSRNDCGTKEKVSLSFTISGLFIMKIKLFSRVSQANRLAWLPAMAFALFLSACGGGGGGGGNVAATDASTAGSGTPASGTPAGAPASAASVAMPASVRRNLEVPDSLAEGTFAGTRSLNVPPNFGVRLWSRVEGARFMALAPNGDVLVSVPGSGEVLLLRERTNDVPQRFVFAGGLSKPHDMVFHRIGGTTYLYIAESNRVTRSVYTDGATQSGTREVVVDNLPDESTPELRGAYSHQLKNIALSPDNKLYVSIASTCNVCPEDATSDPVRGAIYQYDADGSNRRLFARGVRNAEGLDFLPGTNQLWAAMIGRDMIPYPFDNDFDGDGESDYGRIMDAYVDENPPELFTRVRDGGHYGWPFCNPVANPEMANLGYARDYSLNRDGTRLDCASADRAAKGIRAHSTPLGVSFLHDSNVPAAYRKGAVVALRGCWNCSSLRAGFKVIYFPFDDAGNPGAEMDLLSGFVIDPDAREVWGRPVDAIPDAKGNILVSDDHAGAIYQLYPM
jgi:glucose/arabinose dehydrogenase